MKNGIATTLKIVAMLQLVLAASFAAAGHHGEKAQPSDIVDTAVAAGQFETLAAMDLPFDVEVKIRRKNAIRVIKLES